MDTNRKLSRLRLEHLYKEDIWLERRQPQSAENLRPRSPVLCTKTKIFASYFWEIQAGNPRQKSFKEQVKSHLFIDDTITDAKTFIFYDIRFPYMRAQTKTCQVIMYVMCHRNILETYTKEGYYGDRVDILSQMIEDTLINDEATANSFGIGSLSLDSIDIYNSLRFYGCIMTFNVPNFR